MSSAVTAIYVRITNLFQRDEKGQGLAEYALILALIAILTIVALTALRGGIITALTTVADGLNSATTGQ